MEKVLIIKCLLFCWLACAHAEVEPVKDGVYKIVSILDNTVLTATWEGRPKVVVTDDWNAGETQEWKVTSKVEDGQSYQVVRNELIRDGELTEELLNERSVIELQWNLVPDSAGTPDVYALNNGYGCLVNNGKWNQVTIEPCDPDSQEQQWTFSYLYETKNIYKTLSS